VNILHSAENPSWHTPVEWVEAARKIMGSIDTDPATDMVAQARICARQPYYASDNGLEQPWSGNLFLNPPGGLWRKFLLKAHAEFNEGRAAQLFYLAFSLEQARGIEPSEWAFPGKEVVLAVPRKRIRFLDPVTGLKGKSPTQANAVLLVLNPENTASVRMHLGATSNLWQPMGG
jgi:hypothetical protein